MIAYSMKGLRWHPGSYIKWMSGIFYPFTRRRCPMILHRSFSLVCHRDVMDLPSSEWQVLNFSTSWIFSPLCLCFHCPCRDPQKLLNESMSFLFTMWTCGKGKLGQDVQTRTIASHMWSELLPYKAEYISTGDPDDWSLLTQATQPSYYKQL